MIPLKISLFLTYSLFLIIGKFPFSYLEKINSIIFDQNTNLTANKNKTNLPAPPPTVLFAFDEKDLNDVEKHLVSKNTTRIADTIRRYSFMGLDTLFELTTDAPAQHSFIFVDKNLKQDNLKQRYSKEFLSHPTYTIGSFKGQNLLIEILQSIIFSTRTSFSKGLVEPSISSSIFEFDNINDKNLSDFVVQIKDEATLTFFDVTNIESPGYIFSHKYIRCYCLLLLPSGNFIQKFCEIYPDPYIGMIINGNLLRFHKHWAIIQENESNKVALRHLSTQPTETVNF